MKRWAIFGYGIFSYALFHAVFLYSVMFIGNFGIKNSLDAEQTSSLGFALSVNLLLLTFFAVQHSGMARPAFKRWITKYIPESAERSTFVLLSNIAMILIFVFWQPIGGVVWAIENNLLYSLITGLYFTGWLIVFLSTFAICHFDLFGLRQIWLQLHNRPYTHYSFRIPNAYKWVRHPLYVGWLTVVWAAPKMTISHFVFTIVTTVYILVAIQLEERDLIAVFGDKYSKYRKRVPMLIPFLKSRNVPKSPMKSKQ